MPIRLLIVVPLTSPSQLNDSLLNKMWSSSFSELAKKAQEAASSSGLTNIPSGMSLFNLDSILQQQEQDKSSVSKKDMILQPVREDPMLHLQSDDISLHQQRSEQPPSEDNSQSSVQQLTLHEVTDSNETSSGEEMLETSPQEVLIEATPLAPSCGDDQRETQTHIDQCLPTECTSSLFTTSPHDEIQFNKLTACPSPSIIADDESAKPVLINQENSPVESNHSLQQSQTTTLLEIEECIQSSPENDSSSFVTSTTNTTTTPSTSLQAEDIAQTYMLQLTRLHSQHESEILHFQQRIAKLEQELAKKDKITNPIAIHDKCLAQLRKLEKEYRAELQEKENALFESQALVGTMETELSVMKRDYQHGQETWNKYQDLLKEHETLKMNVVDSDKYKQQYESLKARAKSVATELREKREEVKCLSDQNKNLAMLNANLEQNNTRLENQLAVQAKILEERNADIVILQSQIQSVQEEHQNGIQTYKKKAQESISQANARLASLYQSKDAAEAALVEAQTLYEKAEKTMVRYQEERDIAVRQVQHITQQTSMEVQEFKAVNLSLTEYNNQLQRDCNQYADKCKQWQEKYQHTVDELNRVQGECKDLRDRMIALSKELSEEKSKCKEYHDQLQKSSTDQDVQSSYRHSMELFQSKERISQLEHELNDMTTLVEELNSKLILYEQENQIEDNGYDIETNHSNQKSFSQLYFVLEKQAELETIRGEVNRLASLISDAESSKAAALDAMEEMRQRMDDAESRLRRYEKLSPDAALAKPGDTLGRNSSLVNIEYLKNIILNYLYAKTLNERKMLLPVLGAVLELTNEEKAYALKSLEDSADIQRVGVSLIENVQNKGIVHGLFGW